MSLDESRKSLADVVPQMLSCGSPVVPQLSGEQASREIGAAFEWALDRARITKQEAAFRMGYSDSGVIGRWISGKEHLQIARTRLIGDVFFREFVIALAQGCPGVEVSTHIKLGHVG